MVGIESTLSESSELYVNWWVFGVPLCLGCVALSLVMTFYHRKLVKPGVPHRHASNHDWKPVVHDVHHASYVIVHARSRKLQHDTESPSPTSQSPLAETINSASESKSSAPQSESKDASEQTNEQTSE
jgi:hypothetical protein